MPRQHPRRRAGPVRPAADQVAQVAAAPASAENAAPPPPRHRFTGRVWLQPFGHIAEHVAQLSLLGTAAPPRGNRKTSVPGRCTSACRSPRTTMQSSRKTVPSIQTTRSSSSPNGRLRHAPPTADRGCSSSGPIATSWRYSWSSSLYHPSPTAGETPGGDCVVDRTCSAV